MTDTTALSCRSRRRCSQLRRVPLFEGLDPEDLQRIAATAVERRFDAGRVLVREGEAGDELFVLLEGRVRVVHRRRPTGRCAT